MSIRQVFKNISYSFTANLVSLAVSVCMVMFVPKYLSVDDYGIWQLFLFYYSYLGFLALGWEDGIYLRYAGHDFAALPRRLMASQFYGDIMLQIGIAASALLVAPIFISDSSMLLAVTGALCLSPFAHLHGLSNLVMQSTNRIKDYAGLMLAERLVLMLSVLTVLALGLADFRSMYTAKICSIIAAACLSAWLCRSLLYPSFPSLKDFLAETRENICVGSKLMLANVASMLMLGAVRYGISMGWDAAVFGRVSLTLGISNFLMVFISSVSVVFFPIVKRLGDERRTEIYSQIRFALSFILLGLLICYYPLKCLLVWWLPQYADSLVYMSVLFPVCLFESKVDLLTNTYLKSLRREALLLRLNLLMVALAVLVTVGTVTILHDLDAAVWSIPVLFACRCIFAEMAVAHLLGLSLYREMLADLVMATGFMLTGWYIDSWLTVAVYGFMYIIYAIMHRKQLCDIYNLRRQ